MSTTIKTNDVKEEVTIASEPNDKKTLYWSRFPGDFVNKYTGIDPFAETKGVGGRSFEGTTAGWYETLAETVLDAHNHIYKRQFRGPNIIEAGPAAFSFLEKTVVFKKIKEEASGILFGFIKVDCNPTMPNDEIRLYLVSDYRISLIPGEPSNPPEMINLGNFIVPAPVLPEQLVEKLEYMITLDQMTVKVLNANVI